MTQIRRGSLIDGKHQDVCVLPPGPELRTFLIAHEGLRLPDWRGLERTGLVCLRKIVTRTHGYLPNSYKAFLSISHGSSMNSRTEEVEVTPGIVTSLSWVVKN